MKPERFLFAPLGIASGLLAGLLAKKAFGIAWSRVSVDEPPEPEQRDTSWPRLAAALALEGAVFRLTAGLVEHSARVAFERATGTWPGSAEPE